MSEEATKTVGVIIYGAYGAIGQMLVQSFLDQGIYPLLAGRNKKKLEALANKSNLPYLCFELYNIRTLEPHLKQAEIFINCAGSLIESPEPVIRSAMKANCHYLDIGGQYHTAQTAFSLQEEAKQHNSVIAIGLGAEFTPTSCLTACLQHHLQNLNTLEVAYDIPSKFTKGSYQSTINRLQAGCKEVNNHQLVGTDYRSRAQKIAFNYRPKSVIQVNTGDLFSAQYDCNSPNIKTFYALAGRISPAVKLLNWIPKLVQLNKLHQLVAKFFTKYSATDTKGTCHFWAQASNNEGQIMTVQVSTPDIYQLTTQTVSYFATYLLRHERSGGVYTPSQLMTWKVIEHIPGCSKIQFGEPDL